MAATAIPVPNSGEIVATSWGKAVADAHNGIQSGQATVAVSSQNSGSVVVTFPRAYASPPMVVATPLFVGGWFGAVNAVTTTQATIAAWFRDATAQTANIPMQWVAIGVPA